MRWMLMMLLIWILMGAGLGVGQFTATATGLKEPGAAGLKEPGATGLRGEPGTTGLVIDIDLSQQAAFLVLNGTPIACSPISSGKPGHNTPRGVFRVITKDLNHSSATYGMIVDDRGQVLVADANSSMRVPSGARFVRAPMPYFMGFTPRHGLHAGYLPGYPASHGCVRMPTGKARMFFDLVAPGTPVRIHGEIPGVRRQDTVFAKRW